MNPRLVSVALLVLVLLAAGCSGAEEATPGGATELPSAAAPEGSSGGVIDADSVAAGMNAIADRAEVLTVDQTASTAGTCLLLDDETLTEVALASTFMPELADVETLIFGRDEQAMQVCAMPGPGGNMRVTLQRVPAADVEEFAEALAQIGDGREIDASVTAEGLPDDTVFTIDSPTATTVVSAGFLQDGILITLQANPVLDGDPADLEALLGVLGPVVESIGATVTP